MSSQFSVSDWPTLVIADIQEPNQQTDLSHHMLRKYTMMLEKSGTIGSQGVGIAA